jgi:hypothetical protein
VIVVDSSVWISYFAGVETDETLRLQAYARQQVLVVGDIILLEVLRGARSEQSAQLMERHFRLFLWVSMLDPQLAVLAARNYRLLRRRGITIRSSIDMLIGTYCLEHGHALLQRDRDFEPMRDHLRLTLA